MRGPAGGASAQVNEAPSTGSPQTFPGPQENGQGHATALPRGWVSRSSRRLEPWILGAISLCLTAVAVLMQADLASAGVVALVPVLAAAWALARPARRQSEFALRALAIAAGAVLLPLLGEGSVAAADALWQLWLILVLVGYALLLPPSWLLGLGALASTQWIVAGLLGTGATGAAPDMLPLVALVPVAALAGAWMRRVDARLEAHCIDLATRLCTLPGLLAYGEELLASRTPRTASLVVLDCSDLLEVREIYGNRIARTLTLRLSAKLAEIAGDRGLAARTGPAEFAVLLPGTTRERAVQVLQQVLGSPSRIEYEAGDSEIVLVPEVLLGEIGEDADELAALHRLLSRKLAAAREHEALRRRYLRRERERHSRPIPMPAERAPARHRAPVPHPGADIPPTIPLPLPAR